MDGLHFDAIARSLATRATRRRTFHTVAGGALAGLLAHIGREDATAACVKPGKKGCKGPRRKKCCRGAACNGGSKRKAGRCVCRGSLTQCGSACVNTATHQRHCGGCGNACEDSDVCAGGSCCDRQLACGANCCQLGQECVDDGCHDPNLNCFPPTRQCNGFCVNLDTDPNNCGSCGKKCAASFVCANGECRCPEGTAECGGEGCVDILSNPIHCGGECNIRCEGCFNGTCGVVQGSCSTGADACTQTDERCGLDFGSRCVCYQSTTGQTRCGNDQSDGGPCGECADDAECAAKYPFIPGVFCTMSGGDGCRCPGSTFCLSPCTS